MSQLSTSEDLTQSPAPTQCIVFVLMDHHFGVVSTVLRAGVGIAAGTYHEAGYGLLRVRKEVSILWRKIAAAWVVARRRQLRQQVLLR